MRSTIAAATKGKTAASSIPTAVCIFRGAKAARPSVERREVQCSPQFGVFDHRERLHLLGVLQ